MIRSVRIPAGTLPCDYESTLVLTENASSALQSMVITKQPQIGGEGNCPFVVGSDQILLMWYL
jgi:hypothetical protein